MSYDETPYERTVMFKFKKHEPTDLEVAIERLHDQMSQVECETEEYSRMADQLPKLYKVKELEASRRISPDTKAAIAANLAGILLIIGHERVNVITTKALSFLTRVR